ncbi:MAG TPA: hypothetical protein VL132_09270 [Planctomycetaceae bacterium]|nr:hypothetical protein [Planctomycetaceae bacterium]
MLQAKIVSRRTSPELEQHLEFRDFSPPAEPTLNVQRDALQKGLGRAMQWARAGRLSKDALLEACLHEQRIDIQCEENRGEWLWNVAQAAGAIEYLREPILEAFRSLSNERDAYQMCVLAGQFAHWGDGRFVDALYDIVERRPFALKYPSIGEGQLMDIAGEPGLLFIAGIRGRLLRERSWEWDDGAIVDWAIEQFGEDRTAEVLQASDDSDVRRFFGVWKNQVSVEPASPGSSLVDQLRTASALDAIADARTTGNRFRMRTWAKYAKADDLKLVMNHLWVEEDPAALAKLLRIFWGGPLPEFDKRLIGLCGHEHEQVRRAAYYALAENRHPKIREFALQRLDKLTGELPVLRLLTKNYEPGDEQRILAAIQPSDDISFLHWLILDLLNVIEANPDSDSSQLGIAVYALSPCANCRNRAVELMVEEGVAPDWLLEECRDDSEEDCRKVVSEQNTPPDGQQSA